MNQEHNQKYDNLIEQMGGLDKIIPFIPVSKEEIQKALTEGDEHLNSISLYKWDKAAGRRSNKANDYWMLFTYKHEIWPTNLSLAERVCVLKRVARRWVENETK